MALEAGDGFISGLVSTNPVGATDPKSQGDDHIRLIKVALKGTFPNLSGAVTSSQAELNLLDGVTATTAELNYLSGVTSAIQTQLNAKLASASYTAADVLSKLLTVDGAGSGLDADLLDGLSSAAFAQLSAANVFTNKDMTVGHTAQISATANRGNITVNGSSQAIFQLGVGGTRKGYVYHDGTSLTIASETSGVFSLSNNSVTVLEFANNGGITSPNGIANSVGYKGIPQNAQSSTYTLVLGDAGKQILCTGGVAYTIPANGTVAFPIGTVVEFLNYNGSGNITVAITTDTMYLLGTGFATTGTRTVALGGKLVAQKVATTAWVCSGIGVS